MIYGEADNDSLIGGDGADTIDGGDGGDTIDGGVGADTIFDYSGPTTSIIAGAGSDTIQIGNGMTGSIDGGADTDYLYVAGSGRVAGLAVTNVEVWETFGQYAKGTAAQLEAFQSIVYSRDDLTSSVGVELAAAGTLDLADELLGRSVNFYGSDGADNLTASNRNDYLYGRYGNDTLIGGSGADTIYGEADNDSLIGGEGADTLDGGDGNDTVEGGLGADTLYGGGGIDTASYLSAVAGVSVSLASNTSTGAEAQGDKLYEIENLSGSNYGDTLTGDAGANLLLGLSGLDTLRGNDGADTLDGGLGADDMAGGRNDDVYLVDDAGDVVTEANGGGTDTVVVGFAYALGDYVENLTLTGSSSVSATGNRLANVILGNAGANVIDGQLGADTMIGGGGGDTYVVDNAGDVVTESAGGGTDSVFSSVTFTLGAELENLTLTGGSTINGTGNRAANSLTGNSAANTLDGKQGADTMAGGLGNDTYYVDDIGDVVTELSDAGRDTVRSSASVTLSGNIEVLVLTGSAALSGTGDDSANTITGNSGANVLFGAGGADTINGGAGADAMSGGAGDDLFIVESLGDTVSEAANEGVDRVQSSVSFTLGANVEDLTLTGSTVIDGFGNDLANAITGNAASNRLDGGAGADILTGGAGDDVYVVDDAGDTVKERSNGGSDRVEASVTYTLASQVETLTLTGSGDIDGTGNTLANAVVGNAGANRINGWTGVDTLTGGEGSDVFVFNTTPAATNVDRITDFTTGSDVIELATSVFKTLPLGALSADAFVVGSAAADASDRVIYNSSTGALFFDRDGSGTSYAAVQFATLTNFAGISAADLTVV